MPPIQQSRKFPAVATIALSAFLVGYFSKATPAQPILFPPATPAPTPPTVPTFNPAPQPFYLPPGQLAPTVTPVPFQPESESILPGRDRGILNSIASLYRVEVAGNDLFLLAQVQAIAPDAFIREGDGTIQVGSFSQEANAQQLVQRLALQGIASRIVSANVPAVYAEANRQTAAFAPSSQWNVSATSSSIPSPPNSSAARSFNPTRIVPDVAVSSAASVPLFPDETEAVSAPAASVPLFPEETETVAARPEQRDRGFYVVIPGNAEQLREIARALTTLGVKPGEIQEREQPRGLHLAIGPFSDREEANFWNSLFRARGMDARLYYH